MEVQDLAGGRGEGRSSLDLEVASVAPLSNHDLLGAATGAERGEQGFRDGCRIERAERGVDQQTQTRLAVCVLLLE
jgi:hypothetical protein